MKRIYFSLVSLSIGFTLFAQVDTISTNIYQNNGNIGIGTNSANTLLEVIGEETDLDGHITTSIVTIKNNNYSRYRTEAYSNDHNRNGQIIGIRARGTMEKPLGVQPNDRVFGMYGHIYDNDEMMATPTTSIEYFVGDSVKSGEITFSTLSPNEQRRSERMRINSQGYIGIGTTDPMAKLQITDGDIYISDIDKGIIMKSPDGNCWRGVVDNSGQLNFFSIDCPELKNELQHTPLSTDIEDIITYPNPTNTKINIELFNAKRKKLEYKIFNYSGQLLSYGKIKENNEKIDISNFTAGIYILSIYNKNGDIVNSQKIMKE